jgi:hypothetical protein
VSNARVKDTRYEHDADLLISDIDGDDRADYCIIQDDGELQCWRNGGLSDHSSYWQDMGVVFNAVGKKGEDIQLIDINGDGRADWIVSTSTLSSPSWLLNSCSGPASKARLIFTPIYAALVQAK